MRIILTPLEENYQTITLRATELESFHSCAFKHKYAKKDFSNNDALLFGTLTHAVLQSYFFSSQAGMDTLDILCNTYQTWCDTIFKYIQLIEWANLTSQYRFICSEYKCISEIELGKYLVILEWTIDAISKDTNWRYTLIDFKTSKAERKPDQYESKLQKYIYTRLLSHLVGEDMVKGFDYIILTKHVKPRLQVLKYETKRDEINAFMKALLENYCTSLSTNMWNPKICTSCFFCPLKTTCPLKQIGTYDEF